MKLHPYCSCTFANHFTRLSMFHVDTASWKLGELTSAKEVLLAGEPGSEGQPALTWVAHDGWQRVFSTAGVGRDQRVAVKYDPFIERTMTLEPPAYFKETEDPDADRMTFGELQQYITRCYGTLTTFNILFKDKENQFGSKG